MKLSAKKRARLEELAREAAEIVGGCLHSDGTPMTFEELEDQCVEAGDLVTTTMLVNQVRNRERPVTAPCCPTCNRAGTPLAEDEVRVLQTDRGEVSWMEPTFHCRPCRRNFFPSLR